MAKSKVFLLVSLILLIANFSWLLFFEHPFNNDFVYNDFYTFTGIIKERDKKLNGWNLIVEPYDLPNFSGRILLNITLYPEYYYNDIIEISCQVNKPEPIIDDTGSSFAYDKYLAKDSILATCYRPRINFIQQNKDLSYYIFQVKDYFWNNLNNYLVEPASSLAKALLLAARREITESTRNIFARVGLSHTIAISGLHIAIIIWLLQSFLGSLSISRKLSLWILLIILFLYLYLIGFPSSAVRASLMSSVVLLGPLLKRITTSIYSLLLVLDIFILINPYLLLSDIGFQLSFLAVLGLLLYVRFFNKVLVFIPTKFKIREVLAVTLAAQVFTWPLIIYYFNIFSLIAPIANFLILPFLPIILILSLILSLTGFIPFLAQLIAWPLFILLKIIIIIADYLSKIPLAYVTINDFSLVYLIISLLFMIIITCILKPQQHE